MATNVLLQLEDLPRFGDIKPEHIKPAVEHALSTAQKEIEHIKSQSEVTWQNTSEALTTLTEQIGRIWGVVGHLHSVVNTPELRNVYNEMLPAVTEFFTNLGQDIVLYERFKKIQDSDEFATLSSAQKQKLSHDLRDFVLSGAELSPENQDAFAQIQAQLAALAAQFAQNLLDATDDFALYFADESELGGLSDDHLAMFAAAAENEDKKGYKIGLQMPHYLAVMQYADNRELREKVYHAYVTRASEFGPAEWDNTPIIDARLSLTNQEAELLGFDSYADLSIETKMAQSPAEVIHFLEDLAERGRPAAQKDYNEIVQFAREKLSIVEPKAWDLTYASEKLKQEKYAFSDQEIKNYFPVDKVKQGLFELINRLYQVTFTPKNVSVWHPAVQYYELTHDNKVIGGVYMDLYAREGKNGGAWMNDYRGRRKLDDHIQTPIAYLVCNFTPPVNGQNPYLTHDEITTLFHEMGHGLHHLLTQVDELGVSGINGVEWDAVELPSQFMENFAWEYGVLENMSAHKETGEALPQELYQKMLTAKNFQKGMWLVRQMEFALFDMMLYQGRAAEGDWQALLNDVRQKVSVVFPPEYNRFANSFGHIFAGGYAAGYYSYSWAEVLSCDAYAAFEEEPNNPKVGQKFWQEILAVGGSRSAMDSFIAFRGRKPSIDAYLRLNGM